MLFWVQVHCCSGSHGALFIKKMITSQKCTQTPAPRPIDSAAAAGPAWTASHQHKPSVPCSTHHEAGYTTKTENKLSRVDNWEYRPARYLQALRITQQP